MSLIKQRPMWEKMLNKKMYDWIEKNHEHNVHLLFKDQSETAAAIVKKAMLNQLGKLVIELMQWVYTEEKTLRIIQPNRSPRDVEVNKLVFDDFTNAIVGRINDVTVGRYDVQVVSGSTLPSNRWARFEYYKELFQLGVIDQVELLQQTDVANMEAVLERAGQQQQLMQQTQALEEEVKKLKGDLQTAQRESLHDRKRVELKDFEVKLAKLEAQMSAAAQLYKNRTNDHL